MSEYDLRIALGSLTDRVFSLSKRTEENTRQLNALVHAITALTTAIEENTRLQTKGK